MLVKHLEGLEQGGVVRCLRGEQRCDAGLEDESGEQVVERDRSSAGSGQAVGVPGQLRLHTDGQLAECRVTVEDGVVIR